MGAKRTENANDNDVSGQEAEMVTENWEVGAGTKQEKGEAERAKNDEDDGK